jgi:hypothetical protein
MPRIHKVTLLRFALSVMASILNMYGGSCTGTLVRKREKQKKRSELVDKRHPVIGIGK